MHCYAHRFNLAVIDGFEEFGVTSLVSLSNSALSLKVPPKSKAYMLMCRGSQWKITKKDIRWWGLRVSQDQVETLGLDSDEWCIWPRHIREWNSLQGPATWKMLFLQIIHTEHSPQLGLRQCPWEVITFYSNQTNTWKDPVSAFTKHTQQKK